MKRLREAWFEFNGKRSTQMGVKLIQMPSREQPARNVTRKQVSGRNGRLAIDDGTYDDVAVKVDCYVDDASRLPGVLAWLTGSGALRFSDAPYEAYDASVEKEYRRTSVLNHLDGQKFAVEFTCHPFKRVYPAPMDMAVTASGTRIVNRGTATSRPRVKIAGSGGFSVTIGERTMYFTGVTGGGIIVDSELMDAFTFTGDALANEHVVYTGEDFFEIAPGASTVSWETGLEDEAGSVTRVTITPRWRNL
ncbi:MAG: hypothetical protein E7317_04835 [Clostridiales bacterium]|nr:hypothetical protein [Clostridiales bacterium]